jgi:hypothetical protein
MRFAPLGLVLLAGSAYGQTRPILTEEATTAPSGTIVLEAGAAAIAKEPNFVTGHERTVWDVPELRMVYSPAGNVEVDLEWTGRIVAVHDPDFGTVSDFGDVVLRTKLRFVDLGPGRPAFGARYTLSLPETNSLKGLGPNTERMSAQFLLTVPAGSTRVHVNAGVAIEDKPLEIHAQSDFFAYGLALEQPVGGRFSVLAEANGRGVGKGYAGADRRGEARAGVRYAAGHVRFDAAARRGYEPADGHWGFTAGLAWTIR